MRTITPKYDIPEIDQIPCFKMVMDDLLVGNNSFLVGPAGTGKSTLAQKIAYAMAGRMENDGGPPPLRELNCSQWTSPIEIKGGQTMDGYQEGLLIECWQNGWVLIIDEIAKLDANTAGLFNGPLAKAADPDAIIFNGRGEAIKKHPNFGCIATGNVLGKGTSSAYVANNKQDPSLLDRFSACIYHVGFNETLEKQLIYGTVFTKCVEIRNEILENEGKDEEDQDTEDIMTLRTMINLQRGYILEMMRETGQVGPDKKKLKRLKGGKTLKDGFESYFLAMSPEKARLIKDKVEIQSFYNSYRGGEEKTAFLQEYERRSQGK